MNKRKFGYTDNLEFTTPDEYFTPEEKLLFLQIPHKVEIMGKIDKISFEVPENGKYPVLARVNLISVKTPISNEERRETYFKYLHGTSYMYDDDETGFFIQANHGTEVFKLLQELVKHDKENGLKLLREYHEAAVHTEDIESIQDIFVKQVEQMQEYLKVNNIATPDYQLDYKIYKGKTDEEMQEIREELYKKYGEGDDFPSYNDLDYRPMLLDRDYCIYDSSSAKLFIVKDESESKKIYIMDRDRDEDETSEEEEWIMDFFSMHNQNYIHLKNKVTERNLIGEIKNGRLVKASVEINTMHLLQSFMVEQLVNEGKIIQTCPKLSFHKLLENYTRQNEYYYVEERAFPRLLNDLVMVGDNLSYKGFSLMSEDIVIKHEIISARALQDISLSHLNKLPSTYKTEINNYLKELALRDNNENAQSLIKIVQVALKRELTETEKDVNEIILIRRYSLDK